MHQRLQEILRRADLDSDSALVELDAIVAGDIAPVSAWMRKACIHFDRDQYHEAAEAFSNVVKRQPEHPEASLGLFHSLWSIGQPDAAFEEMKRYFLAAGPNPDSIAAREYHTIIREVNGVPE